MSTAIAAPVDRLLYKPEEAAEALAIGRSTVYENYSRRPGSMTAACTTEAVTPPARS
ncbi:hypothetical protein [Streptomyces fungicidicus]